MAPKVAVYLEIGARRTFACATEWPGWCRSARGEQEALEALVAYGPRYKAAMGSSARALDPPRDVAALTVVERHEGDAGTEFGVPSIPPAVDDRPLEGDELVRLRALLNASWSALDAAAAAAKGVELRKGPRGGGRDLDKIVVHAREADEAYLHQLGSKVPRAKEPDAAPGTKLLRETALAAFAARARGQSPAEPNTARKLWSPRYFVRRATWHLLDHAWEIEDRARFVQDGPDDKGADAGAQSGGQRRKSGRRER